MGNPTRFANGVTSIGPGATLSNYPLPDPYHTGSKSTLGVTTFQSDYHTFDSASYTLSGAGSTVTVSSTEVNGAITMNLDSTFPTTTLYKTNPTVSFDTTGQLWFDARVKWAAADSGTGFVGLWKDSTEALFFKKDSANSISLVSTVGGTPTTLASGLGTITAATYQDLGFYFNGTDLTVTFSDAPVARVSAPTIGTTISSAALKPVFQITPKDSTGTLTVDFVFTSKEVTR